MDENAKASDVLLAAMRRMEGLRATEHEELAEAARTACERAWWALFAARHGFGEPPDDVRATS
jgi:hypothetical protein